jgi:hypothetical protein
VKTRQAKQDVPSESEEREIGFGSEEEIVD